MSWNWSKFEGSEGDLKWSKVDLGNLEEVLPLVPKKRIAVQAGGNLGLFAKRLAQDFEWVYTFEPDPELFAAIQKNAPEPNIFRYQAAVGCKKGFVSLSRERRDGKPALHLGVTHVIQNYGPIPLLRIDDFEFPVLDLLYLDIEGYEPFAIEGAHQTIKRCRPVIVVEINKSLDHVGVFPDSLRAQILDHGYRFVKKVRSDEIFVPKEFE